MTNSHGISNAQFSQYNPGQIVSIIREMADFAGVTPKAVMAQKRGTLWQSRLRAMIAKYLHEQMGITRSHIGSLMGRSESWANGAIRTINRDIDDDPELQYYYAELLDVAYEARFPSLAA